MSVQKPALQVIEIPVDKILPNPDNPRGPIDPEDAKTMAESLIEEGQKDEVRVRHLTEAEEARHPGYEWFMIGGHRRLAGAKLAGLPTLRAIVVEASTPEQEFLDALLDNRSEDMGWWKWDLAIEKVLKPANGEGQRKLAAQLGYNPAKINRAWKITQALSPAARALVEESVAPRNTQNKGFLITESILLALADLEDPQEVEKALTRVVEDKMTESQVRQMVANLKGGLATAQTAPKASQQPGITPSATSPKANQQPTSPSSLPSPLKGEGEGKAAGKGAVAGLLAGLFKRHSGHSKQAAPGWGGVGKFLSQNFKRALGTLARRWMVQGLAVIVIVLLISPHLPFSLYHLVSGSISSQPKAAGFQAPQGKTQATAQALVLPASGLRSQTEAQGLNVPIPEKQGIGNQGVSTPKSLSPEALAKGDKHHTSNSAQVVPSWAREERIFAAEFGSRFYGVNAQNWDDTQNYFIDHLNPSYLAPFLHQYFGADFTNQVRHHNLAYSLDGAQSQFLRMKGGSGIFLFKGLQTKEGDGQSPVSLPVALVIQIQHHPDGNSLVEKVTVVNPGEEGDQAEKTDGSAKGDLSPGAGAVAGGSAKGEDPLKAVSDRVKDVQGAVNTANDAKSAADKARALFGF